MLFSSLSWISVPEKILDMNFCSNSVSGKYISNIFSVRYRKSDELKSRALLNRRWHHLYLHISLIQCCRYLCSNRCICKTLIFSVTDALFLTNVSATCFSLNLQMLFSLSIMYNCICILPFLGFKDTPFANFASTSHIFDNVKMLTIKILHLQSPKIHYRRYCRSISFVAIYFTT